MNKIVHVMMACFYKNGFGYQENILPAKHKELGYDVEIVTYNQGGDASYNNGMGAPLTYINPDGISVHVLESNHSLLRKIPFLNMKINTTKGLYKKLEEINPDIIFVHGITSNDNLEVVKYKRKNPKVFVYVDNHSDYFNAPLNSIKDIIYRKIVGRSIGKRLSRYAEKVWGVTPWRVKYQEDVFGVSPSKSKLLVMGGDEKKIDWDNRLKIRTSIREKLSIPQEAFIFITGGKINKEKNIHLLVDAIKSLNRENVYLIIFGRFESDMSDFELQIGMCKNIKNIGWINADQSYDYFLASDFAVFPGTHSVLWEQACAVGIPALFKDWDGGFSHVDVGGNCILLKEISVDSIKKELEKLIDNKDTFNKLNYFASTKARKEFSYIEIAKRSIGLDN